jgi:hypothetical protein
MPANDYPQAQNEIMAKIYQELMQKAAPMMTPDEAAALVQEKIELAEHAAEKYAVPKYREVVLKDISLPTEAVRALLVGYKAERTKADKASHAVNGAYCWLTRNFRFPRSVDNAIEILQHFLEIEQGLGPGGLPREAMEDVEQLLGGKPDGMIICKSLEQGGEG